MLLVLNDVSERIFIILNIISLPGSSAGSECLSAFSLL